MRLPRLTLAALPLFTIAALAIPAGPRAVAAELPPQPTISERATAAKRVNAVFGKQMDAAHSSAETRKLVGDLVMAAESESDPATKFTLLDDARQSAVAAEDMPLAISVVRKLAASFAAPSNVPTPEYLAQGNAIWERDGATAADKLAAAEWYVRAERDAVGLDKMLIEKRLEEVAAIQPAPEQDNTKFVSAIRASMMRGQETVVATVRLSGKTFDHSIYLIPKSNGDAAATYDLPAGYRYLSGTVGMGDHSTKAAAKSPVTFIINADGKQIWKSKRIQKRGDGQAFHVNIARFSKLELVVECHGDNWDATSFFGDPKLSR